MGCDIHFWVERQRPDGQWELAGEEDYDTEDHPFTIWRNYNLFSILANVRNGYGFAGVDTGEGFVPIAEPKGLPEGVCSRVRAEHARWEGDAHSTSWFTLAELQAYDWEQVTKLRGIVSAHEYAIFKEKGAPESWCGGVSGPRIEHVSNEEMEKRIASGELSTAKPERFGMEQVFTKIEWTRTYRECCRSFVEKTIPALRELGEPERVRIVFWFDN